MVSYDWTVEEREYILQAIKEQNITTSKQSKAKGNQRSIFSHTRRIFVGQDGESTSHHSMKTSANCTLPNTLRGIVIETQLEMTSKWKDPSDVVCTVPLSPHQLDGMLKISNLKLEKNGGSSFLQKSFITFWAQRHESTSNAKRRLSRAPCREAGYSANAALISIRSLRSQTMCAHLDKSKSNASLIWQINLESRRAVI